MTFARNGGRALKSYPQFQRLLATSRGYRFQDPKLVRQHRMSIGVITSDAAIQIRFANGRSLGTVEESFLSRLKRGDRFLFAGRRLELVRIRETQAVVRECRGSTGAVPRWMGGRMPLSTELASGVRELLERAGHGSVEGPEMSRMSALLQIQKQVSALPSRGTLLVETLRSRQGWHLFLYPFAGRLAHEGLAAVLAWRFSRRTPVSMVYAANDYGLELLAAREIDFMKALPELLTVAGLQEDILAGINELELARRRFREIARIAGLTFEGLPGRRKKLRAMQVSSNLLFEVFRNYEPDHLLLQQARREVLQSQLEELRLRETLQSLARCRLLHRHLDSPSPMAYPLFVERLREQLSSEELVDRVRSMELALERRHPALAGHDH